MRDAVPAAGLTRPAVLTLLVPGEEPGEVREVPLRYVARESGVYVMAHADPLPSWAGTLRAGGMVRWRIGDRLFSGHALPVSPGDTAAAGLREELTRNHGRRRVQAWFGPDSVAFVFRPQTVQDIDEFDILEAHFDGLAHDYDRLIAANPLDAALRQSSVRTLLHAYRPGDRVLEIGCGTGHETLALARNGIDVVALDLSREMLDRLTEKARAESLLSRITPRKLRASELGCLRPEYGDASFQGAFSDFGALNLEPRVDGVAAALAGLVRPAGTVVLAIWNRTCLAEMSLYALGLRPRRALARLSSPVPVGLSRFGLPAFPYTPGPFLNAFRPAFETETLEALPFLVPPYDFLPHIPRPDRLIPLLESMDRPLRNRFPFNHLGDHFLATLRRV